jgi:hypothetical protein
MQHHGPGIPPHGAAIPPHQANGHAHLNQQPKTVQQMLLQANESTWLQIGMFEPL